jgi:hypothetical protein
MLVFNVPKEDEIRTEDVVMCQVPVSVVDTRATRDAYDNPKGKHSDESNALT